MNKHHPDVERWRPLVEKYWLGIPADHVLIVIWGESRGNPKALSETSNARGLMQHLQKYWEGRFWNTVRWLKTQGIEEKWMKGRRRLKGGKWVRVPQSPNHPQANIAVGAYLHTIQKWGAWPDW